MPDEPTDPATTSHDGDGAPAAPSAPAVRARRPAPPVVPRHLRPEPTTDSPDSAADEAPAEAAPVEPDSLAGRLQELEARINAEPAAPAAGTAAGSAAAEEPAAPVKKAAPRKAAVRKAPAKAAPAAEAAPDADEVSAETTPVAAAASTEEPTAGQVADTTTDTTTDTTADTTADATAASTVDAATDTAAEPVADVAPEAAEPTLDAAPDTTADTTAGTTADSTGDAPTEALALPADAADAAAPAAEAPAPVKAAKRAPAKSATKAPAKAPAQAAAKAPAKKAAPVRKAPAKKAIAPAVDLAPAADQDASIDDLLGAPAPEAPAPRRTKVAPAAVASDAFAVTAEPPAYRPATELVPAQRGAGPLWALAALLLAVAVGLGVAALVRDQDHTWEAKSLVTLTPGSASSNNVVDALRAGPTRYLAKTANDSFTAVSALKANMPQSEIREKVEVVARGGDQLALTARASTGQGALSLANASGLTLAATVQSGEALEPNPGERLGAFVVGPSPEAVRTSPTDTEVLVAGLLGGAAVLLLAGVLALIRRSNAPR